MKHGKYNKLCSIQRYDNLQKDSLVQISISSRSIYLVFVTIHLFEYIDISLSLVQMPIRRAKTRKEIKILGIPIVRKISQITQCFCYLTDTIIEEHTELCRYVVSKFNDILITSNLP